MYIESAGDEKVDEMEAESSGATGFRARCICLGARQGPLSFRIALARKALVDTRPRKEVWDSSRQTIARLMETLGEWDERIADEVFETI